MTRQNIPLGRILGIPVGLDYSWFLIFALFTWSPSLRTGRRCCIELAAAAVLVHRCTDGHHALRQRAAP
jgi:hypothetical protein